MTKRVSLKSIIEALESLSGDGSNYLQPETGEIVVLDTAGDTGTELIPLPTRWEIHENQIMENFCFSLTDDKLRGDLFFAIKGYGALEHFNDYLKKYKIETQWQVFRRETLRKITIEWCTENGLEYIEDSKQSKECRK
ncbi:MAG: UPF0158 family protein [bacterium]|jgi:hypothetical protein|nr:UPF0158 family protein [bacterium]